MKHSSDCDYTRPGVEPWWNGRPVDGEHGGSGCSHSS